MVGNLTVSNSGKTTARLFAAALLCAAGTTLLSLWFFRFYADIEGGRSPHSLFVVVASIFVIAAGPRLMASFTAKHLAYLSLLGVFIGAFLAVAVPAWAPVGSGVTAIAGTFLEIFVYKSLLSLPNATMRKVFVVATVGGIFAGSVLPLDAPAALFAASVCMALACALAVFRLNPDPGADEGRAALSVHVRRQIVLRVRPAGGLIVLAFVAHLASANAVPLGPGLTGGAYLTALAILCLSAITHDDTSHISLIRCLVLISAVVCAMRLAGSFSLEAMAFVETALGIIVWTGIIVVALDLATYAEVPFSTIMGGVYLLLTGPAALIYLVSLAAPFLPAMLSSSLADAVIICLLVFCGLYLLNEQSLDDLFWGAHDDAEGASQNNGDAAPATAREEAAPTPLGPDPAAFPSAVSSERETVDAIARLAAEAQLTAREQEVLGLLAEGRSAPFIAEYLSIERSTAKTHVARIYAKLGVHTRQELISLVLSAKGLVAARR
mgnify:FL=1